jgi:hypothetical protein
MKQLQLFFIFAFALLIMFPSLTTAMLDAKTAEIPYQIQNSDRIVLGTVSEIKPYSTYTMCTITVKEWLYNPLLVDTIKVETRIGTNVSFEDEAEFAKNESVLLMLKDINLKNQLFVVTFGFPGKHPISDRNAVIKVLKAQGKWYEVDQTLNTTNSTKDPIASGYKNSAEYNKNASNESNNKQFAPGFELLESLICLYSGWSIRKK